MVHCVNSRAHGGSPLQISPGPRKAATGGFGSRLLVRLALQEAQDEVAHEDAARGRVFVAIPGPLNELELLVGEADADAVPIGAIRLIL